MEPQQYYNVAYSVKLAGQDDAEELVRCYFIRSGRREAAGDVVKMYMEIVREAQRYGYNDPMGFVSDYFSGSYSTNIPVYGRNVDQDRLSALLGGETEPSTATKSNGVQEQRSRKPSTEMKKLKKAAAEMPRVKRLEPKVAKPEKLPDADGASGVPIEIPLDAKSRIAKSKRSSPYYREQSAKEREADNRFDYFVMHTQRSGTGKVFYDARGMLEEHPLMGEVMGDFDVEFRRIMSGIYNRVKNQQKDKSRKQEDLEVLQGYFERKLAIAREDDAAGKRLASAVAYLMKKLQIKLFENDNPSVVRGLLFFKTQLYLFYSYYRR